MQEIREFGLTKQNPSYFGTKRTLNPTLLKWFILTNPFQLENEHTPLGFGKRYGRNYDKT
jgi:hypothetical protein